MAEAEGFVVNSETKTVSTGEYGKVPVALKHRKSDEDLVVFLHGLGCAKESFDDAFEADALAQYSLLALDFPEHGDSVRMGSRADLACAAEVARSLLDDIPRRRVHLVCHSMGGAVGVIVAQTLPDLAAFISVEGNLVAEDCGLVSRGIAMQTSDEFAQRGFAAFVRLLETSTEPSHLQWARWYQRCDARGLHQLARSLVEWCDSDKLVDILSTLKRASYVHGEYSEVDHVTDRVSGLPLYPVARSGHFPMLDNAEDFYALVGAIVDDAREIDASVSLDNTGARRVQPPVPL